MLILKKFYFLVEFEIYFKINILKKYISILNNNLVKNKKFGFETKIDVQI